MLIAGNDALNFPILGRWLEAFPVIGDSVDALAARSTSAGLQRLILVDCCDINCQRNSTSPPAAATAISRDNGLAELGVFVDARVDVPCRWIVPIEDGVESDLGRIILVAEMFGHDVVLLIGWRTSHVLVLLADVVEERRHGIVGTDVHTNLHGGPHGRGSEGRPWAAVA